MKFLKLFAPVVILLVLLFGLSSCGPAPLPQSGTFGNVYTVTLNTACINCHVPSGAPTVNNHVKLDFTSQATAYSTLTTSSVSGDSSKNICPGVKNVFAGDPTKSYFAAVLISQYNKPNFAGVSGCTPYTAHLQDQHLSAAEVSSLTAWIQGGALNN